MSQLTVEIPEALVALIDRAAKIRGQSRTDFMLGSSESAALEVLTQSQTIQLDDQSYDAFVSALNNPAQPSPRLRALASRTPPWDCGS